MFSTAYFMLDDLFGQQMISSFLSWNINIQMGSVYNLHIVDTHTRNPMQARIKIGEALKIADDIFRMEVAKNFLISFEIGTYLFG